MKKKVGFSLLFILFIAAGTAPAFAGGEKEKAPPPEKQVEKVEEKAPVKPAVKNPDTIIYARYGTIQSLDPHRAYDTSSGEALMRMLAIMVFTQTLLPEPVAPAINRWGIEARSATNASPEIVFPMASLSSEFEAR